MNKKKVLRISVFLCTFGLALSLNDSNLSQVHSCNPPLIKIGHYFNFINPEEAIRLIRKGNILDYLRVRQKLYTYNFAELSQFENYLKKRYYTLPVFLFQLL